MIDRAEKEWNEYIGFIERTAVGDRGLPSFMCRKDEHWKFLWAAERIAALEQAVDELEKELKWLQNQHVRVCSSESKLREAARARCESGHDEWCSFSFSDEVKYSKCNCGHDALAALIGGGDE